MNASYSKSIWLYGEIRRALQSGQYLPGQWIDPNKITAAFQISPMPVRLALSRLVGAGLLEDRGRTGVYVPLPSETAMRELYSWMDRLLTFACDAGATPVTYNAARRLQVHSPDDDLAKLTWQLFDSIARAPGRSPLHQAIKQTNDQLAPIRRAKQHLLDRRFEELSELAGHWHARDYPALRSALHEYHERRIQMVPSLVATLIERRDSLIE